ncbi:MAG: acetyltransferase [Deltaproteobacteria bacterium]|uniref:Acetyltransferase n=1 Tax=Candidatus Zymogenus saltonus TaxID=2844893 RepID=A0A9D8PPD8_9DELT|nr:acetyltransferase [Candidatus Zymogenus saltonus]
MKAPRNLWVFGAGGHGMVVAETAMESGLKVSGFLDDDEGKWGSTVLGLPVSGGRSVVRQGDRVILGIGDNNRRREAGEWLDKTGVSLLTVRSRWAMVSISAVVGDGVVMIGPVVVNAAARIGKGVILNTASTVDHECVISDYVHIAPGVNLAGNVTVGQNSFIGIGAKVIPGIKIGKDCAIGAGCVIVRDVKDGSRVV